MQWSAGNRYTGLGGSIHQTRPQFERLSFARGRKCASYPINSHLCRTVQANRSAKPLRLRLVESGLCSSARPRYWEPQTSLAIYFGCREVGVSESRGVGEGEVRVGLMLVELRDCQTATLMMRSVRRPGPAAMHRI